MRLKSDAHGKGMFGEWKRDCWMKRLGIWREKVEVKLRSQKLVKINGELVEKMEKIFIEILEKF
jgi:hypothetical protein